LLLIKITQQPTPHRNKPGVSSYMTSKQKNTNQLWSDKQVVFTPGQFLYGNC